MSDDVKELLKKTLRTNPDERPTALELLDFPAISNYQNEDLTLNADILIKNYLINCQNDNKKELPSIVEKMINL